jgi:hypothetical protein
MRNFRLIVVSLIVLITVHTSFGTSGKLIVIKVAIASVAGQAFEVQIAPRATDHHDG